MVSTIFVGNTCFLHGFIVYAEKVHNADKYIYINAAYTHSYIIH